MSLSTDEVKQLFASRLKMLRTSRGYSISYLAKKSGISQPYLSQIEQGKKYPSMNKMMAIANALDVELNQLQNRTGDKNLKNLLNELLSNDFKHFPLTWFGFEKHDLLNLLMENPDQAEGLFDILKDLMQLHRISKHDIVHAAIRAYRRRDQRFLMQLEKEAKQVRDQLQCAPEASVTSESIRNLLLEKGYIIDETVLPEREALKGVRFIYVEDKSEHRHPIFYINRDLTEAQKTYLLCYEYYHAKKRILAAESRRIDHIRRPSSIEASLNNYKAKFFAEATIVDANFMTSALRTWFSQQKWINGSFLDMAGDASVGVFMHRVAVIASREFGLKNASLVRFTHDIAKEDGEFHVEREQNLSEKLPPFLAVRSEYLCRRFAAIKALRKLRAMEDTPIYTAIKADMRKHSISRHLPVVIHRSRFVGHRDGDLNSPEYLAIAIAYPRRKNRNIAYSLIFEMDDHFKNTVSFWDDPTIPIEFVARSCERCRLQAPPDGQKASHPLIECHDRAKTVDKFIGRAKFLARERFLHIEQFVNDLELHEETRRAHLSRSVA